jgi:nucleoid-associated protein YgaU
MKGDTVTNKEVLSERKLTEKILAIEEALTRVQEKKIRAIEAKHRMMKELNRYGDTSGDATVVILPEKDLEK